MTKARMGILATLIALLLIVIIVQAVVEHTISLGLVIPLGLCLVALLLLRRQAHTTNFLALSVGSGVVAIVMAVVAVTGDGLPLRLLAVVAALGALFVTWLGTVAFIRTRRKNDARQDGSER